MKKAAMVVFFILFATLSGAEEQITLMTEIFPPYQYYSEDLKLTGISVEIIEAVKKEINSEIPIKEVPWVRGVKITKKKKNNAIFSMLRTPEREKLYKWAGPLVDLSVIFFKKTGSPIVLNSLEDAKKVGKVGVTRNVANYELLSAKGFTNLDVLQNGADENNIIKLIKGRIDLWASTYFGGLYSAKSLGHAGMIKPITNIPIFKGQLYLAFNSKTDDTIVNKWQAGLDKVKSNKTFDKIISRYQ
ncbi:MAG: transporter substrate-binding domain-containing protein [SAR324 cluster bacterium]|nr:transporter substrate-binding domain-containing protein [SAR324 cluster bacterium]